MSPFAVVFGADSRCTATLPSEFGLSSRRCEPVATRQVDLPHAATKQPCGWPLRCLSICPFVRPS
eukprot:4385705-Alexandrium_andersonii.AAC.1